jgi:hypothetical protein
VGGHNCKIGATDALGRHPFHPLILVSTICVMAAADSAIFGLIGVLIGSVITVFGTVYREQITSRREREARTHAAAQDKSIQLAIFQRETVLSLQDAVVAVVRSVYDEQDRMLQILAETGEWRARRWETPTAQGWADAQLRLQSLRARIFDDDLRTLAGEIRATARASIWAASVEDAKNSNVTLTDLAGRFNDVVAERLKDLY